MGDIKLFRYGAEQTSELLAHAVNLEKNLQSMIEKHMGKMLGVRFLAHEYRTGRPQRGSIDSLGLDENNCPVIIEYKRYNNENIISQGLYYLDWLLTHKAEYCDLVKNRLGEEEAASIEFDSARIICLASVFSRYDEYAIMQIDRNIELIRYRLFEDNLLLLETLNTALHYYAGDVVRDKDLIEQDNIGMPPALQERIRNMNSTVEDIYLKLLTFSENLGEDVSVRFLKHYIALTRMRNFTSIQPLKTSLKLWLNLDPSSIELEEGFSRDVSAIGHHASGNVEVEVKDEETFKKVQPLIELAYQNN